MAEGQDRKNAWMRRAAEVWTVIGVLVLLAALFSLLGRITSALVPFGMALVIVLVLRKPVDMLERRGMLRVAAVLVCYLATIVVVAIVSLVLVPTLVQQIVQFGGRFPEYSNKAYQLYLDMSARFTRLTLPSFLTAALLNIRDSATAWAVGVSTTVASGAVAVTSQIAGFVFDALIALLIALYVLVDYAKMREEVLRLFGRQRDHADHFINITGRVLGGYLRGVALDGLTVFAVVAVGLSVLRVPGAIVIAVFAGLVNVVPYLGPGLAMALACVSGLFVSPWLGLWAVVVVIVATQIDGFVVNPRIMSGQVDLHPVLVVFSLLTGATLFGVAGMILAIPVAAISKAVFMYWYELRTGRDLATPDGVLFSEREPGASSEGGVPREDDHPPRGASLK
jgi:predicted PurR-regulated permease PerM